LGERKCHEIYVNVEIKKKKETRDALFRGTMLTDRKKKKKGAQAADSWRSHDRHKQENQGDF